MCCCREWVCECVRVWEHFDRYSGFLKFGISTGLRQGCSVEGDGERFEKKKNRLPEVERSLCSESFVDAKSPHLGHICWRQSECLGLRERGIIFQACLSPSHRLSLAFPSLHLLVPPSLVHTSELWRRALIGCAGPSWLSQKRGSREVGNLIPLIQNSPFLMFFFLFSLVMPHHQRSEQRLKVVKLKRFPLPSPSSFVFITPPPNQTFSETKCAKHSLRYIRYTVRKCLSVHEKSVKTRGKDLYSFGFYSHRHWINSLSTAPVLESNLKRKAIRTIVNHTFTLVNPIHEKALCVNTFGTRYVNIREASHKFSSRSRRLII